MLANRRKIPTGNVWLEVVLWCHYGSYILKNEIFEKERQLLTAPVHTVAIRDLI